jgi:APA family basic amino acid/polyamine antiporter
VSSDTQGWKRELTAWDAASLAVGAVIGTAIFLTPADIARELPHAGWILAVWVLGGALTLAGALTYGELGAMFPRAGGQYHYLKEAWGTLPAFLFGWVSFFVIMSGGIAAIGAGFGEYLGIFVPFFSNSHRLATIPLGTRTWSLTGGQFAGAMAIAGLTAANVRGVREGARIQNLFTVAKVAALAVFVGAGLVVAAPSAVRLAAPAPPRALASAGVALIAVIWAYDGWYVPTFSAAEMRDPRRGLPRGLIAGTLAVLVLYTAANLVYLRALPLDRLATSPRAAETAAVALFGPGVARAVSLAILIAMFGCLSANVLACARIYQPMAADGLFFRALARLDPRRGVPTASLVAQGIWSIVLVLSGTFEELFTYVVFIEVVIFASTGAAIFRLRRTRPDAPRPYRAWGYPVVPALFVLVSLAIAVNTLVEKPKESLAGLLLLVIGVPAYLWWRRTARRNNHQSSANAAAIIR